jgi:hypothetical protein
MTDRTDEELLRLLEKYSRVLVKGLISPNEFASALLEKLAGAPGDRTYLAPEVAAALTPAVRAAVVELIQEFRRGDFRRPGFRLGPGPKSDAEEERESAIRTAKLKAWGEALGQQFVEGGQTGPSE